MSCILEGIVWYTKFRFQS